MALRIRQLASGRAARGRRPAPPTRTCAARGARAALDSGTGATSVAKAYRLLRAIMSTAVDDGIIRRNPCRIRGAGLDRSPERSVLTIRQVARLADAIGPRYGALILLAVYGSLRWGELAALRRGDFDLDKSTVRIERSLTEMPGGGYSYGPPKSAAGRRIGPSCRKQSLTWGCRHRGVRWDLLLSDPVVVRLGGQR